MERSCLKKKNKKKQRWIKPKIIPWPPQKYIYNGCAPEHMNLHAHTFIHTYIQKRQNNLIIVTDAILYTLYLLISDPVDLHIKNRNLTSVDVQCSNCFMAIISQYFIDKIIMSYFLNTHFRWKCNTSTEVGVKRRDLFKCPEHGCLTTGAAAGSASGPWITFSPPISLPLPLTSAFQLHPGPHKIKLYGSLCFSLWLHGNLAYDLRSLSSSDFVQLEQTHSLELPFCQLPLLEGEKKGVK